ncbi:chloride channel protein [Corynebacterium kroppenstedtii]|uniref:chloride channel protein n=1 Tax=Corynebacterium sp. PCR 32 TaxID=3351342 RepID=UPI0030A4582E
MTRSRHLALLTGSVIVLAILTGLAAALLNILFLHVEALAFGSNEATTVLPPHSSSPTRIIMAFLVSGTLGALIWWGLHRWGRPQPTVTQSLRGAPSPIPETTAHAALQVAQVGTGASIGRENAPRIAGVLCADRLAAWTHVSPEFRQLMVASAAGGGLAAAYHAPLAGIAFTIEICALGLRPRSIAIATTTCAIATGVSSHIEPAGLQYTAPAVTCTWPMLISAVFIGAIVGPLGVIFRRLTQWCQHWATHDARVLYRMPIGFAVTGVVVVFVPDVAGNGKYATMSTFSGTLTWRALAQLCVLNTVVTLVCLGSGAIGGILTPSFSLGVMVTALGGIGMMAIISTVSTVGIRLSGTTHPTIDSTTVLQGSIGETPVLACAVIGGAAFLATAHRAPLFALLATMEFTGQTPVSIPVLAIAVITATLPLACSAWNDHRYSGTPLCALRHRSQPGL